MNRSIALTGGLLLAMSLSAGVARAATPRSLYEDNCSACHQSSGKGVKGAFPALAGAPVAQGDPAPLMATVLAGRESMPSFKDDLNDADLAALLTYVRTAWGNRGAPLTPGDVAAARARLKSGKARAR